MSNVQKLAEMGCGSAIINSCIDRGNIHAAVSNGKQFLTYYKYAVKNELYTKEQAINGIMPYYNKLKEVEDLANLYSHLWLEKYTKVKLQIEKFIN